MGEQDKLLACKQKRSVRVESFTDTLHSSWSELLHGHIFCSRHWSRKIKVNNIQTTSAETSENGCTQNECRYIHICQQQLDRSFWTGSNVTSTLKGKSVTTTKNYYQDVWYFTATKGYMLRVSVDIFKSKKVVCLPVYISVFMFHLQHY